MQHVKTVVRELLANSAVKATKYVSPTMTVKATRHGRPRRNEKKITMVLTIGRPNYAERRFIKDCRKAGEPFPVRKVQLKFAPRRK